MTAAAAVPRTAVYATLIVGVCIATACSRPADVTRSESPPTSIATLTLPTTSPEAADASSTPLTTGPPSATPSVDDDGNVHAVLGAVLGLTSPDGAQIAVLSVDSVTTTASCPGDPSLISERGQFLTLRLRVSTGDLTSIGGGWSVSANDFAVIDSDDHTTDFDVATTAAQSCADTGGNLSTITMAPGSEYSGSIVLDSPIAYGAVSFTPPQLQGRGWQWPFR